MLSCSCYDNYDWWYTLFPDQDFEVFDKKRRKRCASCKNLIDIGSNCLKFDCFTNPRSDIEEMIHGDEVPIADRYLCEKCGEIFLNLTELGYCLELGHDLKEDLEDYWDLTGFNANPTTKPPNAAETNLTWPDSEEFYYTP